MIEMPTHLEHHDVHVDDGPADPSPVRSIQARPSPMASSTPAHLATPSPARSLRLPFRPVPGSPRVPSGAAPISPSEVGSTLTAQPTPKHGGSSETPASIPSDLDADGDLGLSAAPDGHSRAYMAQLVI